MDNEALLASVYALTLRVPSIRIGTDIYALFEIKLEALYCFLLRIESEG